MPGATLSTLISNLKAELGVAPASTSSDARYAELLNGAQILLASEYDFPELRKTWDISYTVGQRFIDIPPDLDRSRPCSVWVFHVEQYIPLCSGIDETNYNLVGEDVRLDPPQRWRFYDGTRIEIWPAPASAGRVRLVGQRNPVTITDTTPSDLDGMLLVYWVAAEESQRMKQPDAPAKLLKARQRLSKLIAAVPAGKRVSLSGRGFRTGDKNVKIVTIA